MLMGHMSMETRRERVSDSLDLKLQAVVSDPTKEPNLGLLELEQGS